MILSVRLCSSLGRSDRTPQCKCISFAGNTGSGLVQGNPENLDRLLDEHAHKISYLFIHNSIALHSRHGKRALQSGDVVPRVPVTNAESLTS